MSSGMSKGTLPSLSYNFCSSRLNEEDVQTDQKSDSKKTKTVYKLVKDCLGGNRDTDVFDNCGTSIVI